MLTSGLENKLHRRVFKFKFAHVGSVYENWVSKYIFEEHLFFGGRIVKTSRSPVFFKIPSMDGARVNTRPIQVFSVFYSCGHPS